MSNFIQIVNDQRILDTTMDLTDENNTFEQTLIALNNQAEEAVREGYIHIILSSVSISKSEFNCFSK